MKKLFVFLGLLLALFTGAQAEAAWKTEVEVINDHADGTIIGNSYSFDIDATLIQKSPDVFQSIKLQKMEISKKQVTDAASTAFQMSFVQADQFITMTDTGFEGSEVQRCPILLHGAHARKPRASEQQMDETLDARLESCKRFLNELGIAYDAVPFTACYVDTQKNTDSGMPQMLAGLNEAKASTGPLYAEIVFLLSSEGLPFAPRIDYMRFGGAMRQQPNDSTLFQYFFAGFLFDENGKLRSMDVALPQGQTKKEISGSMIPWEKAVETFLDDYTATPQVQKVLTHVSYCITDIRLVWAVDGDNTAVPAWYIGMSGYDSDLQASGQKYDRRYMSALVYAFK